MEGFYLISMWRDKDGQMHLGSLYGPFDSKEQAEAQKKNFPTPEWVYIRSLFL